MVSTTPSQLPRTNSSRPNLDTPTPSGHSSVLMTSLRPQRSKTSTFSTDLAGSKQQQPSLQRRNPAPPLTHSLGRQLNIPDLNTQDLDLDNLEIPTDNTELERRILEDEIRRGVDDLAIDRQSAPSLASDHREDSIGFGDLSDAEVDGQDARQGFRARMYDQRSSSSSRSTSSGSESLGDDFSLRIGIAGVRSSNPQKYAPSLSSEDDTDNRDLTYLSLERTLSPPLNLAPPPPPPAPLPPKQQHQTSKRGLGREFKRADQQAAATTSRASAPPPSSTKMDARHVFGDVGNTRARNSPSPLFGLNTTKIPPPSTHSQTYRAPPLSSPTIHSVPRYPPSSRVPPSTSNNAANAGGNGTTTRQETSRIRLPDITGLTEGLQSPARGLGHIPVGATSTSGEGAQLSGALNQLRKRLASLERENSVSAARVRELESRLEEDEQHQQQETRARRTDAVEEGLDWEKNLQAEQGKREALESLVTRLRAHVTHLTHSLKDHSATLSALRSVPRPPTLQSAPRDEELISEVIDLRNGLEGLGEEVGAVKQVVDELVREREVGKRWDHEERERRQEMMSPQGGLARKDQRPVQGNGRAARPRQGEFGRHAEEEDDDVTPRANRTMGGGSERSAGRSFLALEEIERLKRDLAREEEARKSPTPRPRRTKVLRPEEIERPTYNRHQHFEIPIPPHRPSTAPLPPTRPIQVPIPRHHASYDSSIHLSPPPSIGHFRTNNRTRFDQPVRSIETEEEEADDLRRDFARAEEIFRSVSAPKKDSNDLCSVCRRRRKEAGGREEHNVPRSAPAKMMGQDPEYDAGDESYLEDMYQERERKKYATQQQQHQARKVEKEVPRVDPKTTLESVLRTLEADFELHKKIYIELSEQYRAMDSKAGGTKRRTLADHLKESIDTLELKAKKVSGLHDFIHSNTLSSSDNPSPVRSAPNVPLEYRMREGVV